MNGFYEISDQYMDGFFIAVEMHQMKDDPNWHLFTVLNWSYYFILRSV